MRVGSMILMSQSSWCGSGSGLDRFEVRRVEGSEERQKMEGLGGYEHHLGLERPSGNALDRVCALSDKWNTYQSLYIQNSDIDHHESHADKHHKNTPTYGNIQTA